MNSVVALAASPQFQAAVRDGATIPTLMMLFPDWGGRTAYVEARIMARDDRTQSEEEPEDEPIFELSEEGLAAEAAMRASPQAEKHEQTANSWNIELPKTRIKTLEELLAHCEVDPAVWEVKRFACNTWEMGSKDADGNASALPLYQVKAWLEKKRAVIAAKAEIAALIADAKGSIPPVPLPARAYRHEGVLLELSLYDMHMAKLAWAPECGVSYDLRIAESLFNEALEDLLSRAAFQNVAKIVFPIGNDLMHYDTKAQTTTSGTPLDSDTRYAKTFTTTRRMLCRAIERCRDLAPVDVLVVPGNHDELSAFAIGDALDCYFHSDLAVSVDNSAALTKYYEYGRVMLVYNHGKEIKGKDLLGVAASQQPEMWGRTRYREAHVGHLHKVALDEQHGFRVRWMPSLCAPDAWHAMKGFVGNQRSAEALLWSGERGLVGQLVFTVPEAEGQTLLA